MHLTMTAMAPEEERRRLLLSFSESRDDRTREQLITACIPLARVITVRIARNLTREQQEDLIQEALIAVIEAVDRYDPAKGSFETRVHCLIRWRVLEAMRREDPRSRAMQEKASREFIADRAEKPSPYIDPHDYFLMTLNGRLWYAMSIERMDDEIAQEWEPEPEVTALDGERRRLLDTVLSDLPPREAECIRLYYFEQRSRAEVSAALSVSRRRVNQLHEQAIKKLRGRMEDSPPLAKLLSERD